MSYNYGILSKKNLWMVGWSGWVDGWMDIRTDEMADLKIVNLVQSTSYQHPKTFQKYLLVIFRFLPSFYLLCELHPHKQQQQSQDKNGVSLSLPPKPDGQILQQQQQQWVNLTPSQPVWRGKVDSDDENATQKL